MKRKKLGKIKSKIRMYQNRTKTMKRKGERETEDRKVEERRKDKEKG